MDVKMIVSGFLVLLGTVLLLLAVLGQSALPNSYGVVGALLCIGFGASQFFGYRFERIKLRDLIEIELETVPPVRLDPEIDQERREYADKRRNELPDRDAPSFHLLDRKMEVSVATCSDLLMIPMYLLDKNFRILDWNSAFSLCFDRTMEGRRGMSVLEWTYFLDNYQEVLDHGITAFSGGANAPPRLDIEALRYTSRRYGSITGTKRAYQIPNEDGSCRGWLITIEPKFADKEMTMKFYEDLFICLRQSLMWSEYALSYDQVLNSTEIYPELLQSILGERRPGPDPIAANSTVLDLGAGTGNVTKLLADPAAQRLVIAIDNNAVMLEMLRRKCEPYLRQDANGPGVIAIKQDISSLHGLNEDFCDYVILNNVLYSLDASAVSACLSEVKRVLKPGGEVRISGPQKSTKLSKVLDRLKDDLVKRNKFEQLKNEYLKVKQINEQLLAPLLLKWDRQDMEGQLKEAGFSAITYSSADVYAKQSMLVCARK